MVSIFGWIKKQINYLIHSIPDLIKALALFILVSLGLIIAILIRLLDQSGILISIGGMMIEVFALIGVYFLFRKYLKSEEKREIPGSGKK